MTSPISHLATKHDTDVVDGPVALGRVGADLLDAAHDVHTLDDAAEDDVLAVEERGGGARDEELAAVGVGARVGHGEQEGRRVRVREGLVGEAGRVFLCVAGWRD